MIYIYYYDFKFVKKIIKNRYKQHTNYLGNGVHVFFQIHFCNFVFIFRYILYVHFS